MPPLVANVVRVAILATFIALTSDVSRFFGRYMGLMTAEAVKADTAAQFFGSVLGVIALALVGLTAIAQIIVVASMIDDLISGE